MAREKKSAQMEDQIWNQLNKETYLATELLKQYGGEARKVALNSYGSSMPMTTEAKLIEKILDNRKRQYTEHKDNQETYLEHLREQRELILNDQKKLHERKQLIYTDDAHKISPSRGSVVDPSQRQVIWGSAGKLSLSSDSTIHGPQAVESIVRREDAMLPAQISRYNKRREAYQKEWDRIHKPYNGENGPQSYQSWQMENYYMVRSIVDEMVERMLDTYFIKMPFAADHQMQKHLYEIDQKERDNQWRMISESKAVQLLMEELILEVTAQMTSSLGYDFFNFKGFIEDKTNTMYMEIAEAESDHRQRGETDVAYNLVTKGYYSLQEDRNKMKSTVWNHSQPLQTLGAEQTEEVTDDDVEHLEPQNLSPLHLKLFNLNLPSKNYDEKKRIENYQHYRRQELLYWQRMTAAVRTIPVSSKCQGVYFAKVSYDHTMLAIGTYHGDIIIYDLRTEPYRPLRAVSNTAKIDDAVVDIAWNLDGSRLLTVNEAGSLRLWSVISPGVDKKEVKGLDLVADDKGIVPELLTLMLELDMENHDFRFQSGPLVEMSTQDGKLGPSLTCFFPSLSLFGQQDDICVALDNGDILKCDLEEPFYDSTTQEGLENLDKHTPKILLPNVISEADPTIIGQSIPAEMYRQHRHPIIFIGFVGNSKDLVSVDYKGYINIWKYSKENQTSFEWFKPEKRYKFDLYKIVYSAVETAKSKVIFSDKPSSKVVTRQEIAAAREKAEEMILTENLSDPWHIEHRPDQGTITYVFPPKGTIPESGSLFHVAVRYIQTNQLSTYLTKLYRPSRVQASRIMGCKLNRDGTELVIVLLFPGFPPKDSHLSIFRIDLLSLELMDWRRDILIDNEKLYFGCLQQDIFSFDIGAPLGPTGSACIFINLAGELSCYSFNTGQKVLASIDVKNSQQESGCVIDLKALGISATAQIAVATINDTYHLIFYTIDQTKKSTQNRLTVLTVKNDNQSEDDELMWDAFNGWDDRPTVKFDIDQQLLPVKYTFDDMIHPEVNAQQIIMEIVDSILQRKHGQFTEEENDTHEDIDRVDNYNFVRTQVLRRRSIDEDLDNNPLEGEPSLPPSEQGRSSNQGQGTNRSGAN